MSILYHHTAERIEPEYVFRSEEAYLEFLRHLFAYTVAASYTEPQYSVLEIGCGNGYGTAYLAEHVQQIIGLDIQADVVEKASQQYCSSGCRFQCYNGRTIPYADKVFDVIVSFQVIEHLQEPQTLLQDMRRVLKPDGVAILTTPNAKLRLKPGQRPWNRFHVREYRMEQLQHVLLAIFSVVDVWGIRGASTVQRIESVRVHRVRRLAALDVFRLRRLLPSGLETFLSPYLQKLVGKTRPELQDCSERQAKYSLDDFFLDKELVEQALDLIAICRP